MSADAREFLVIVIGALTIIWGITVMWRILEGDREEREAEAERQRLQQRYRAADDDTRSARSSQTLRDLARSATAMSCEHRQHPRGSTATSPITFDLADTLLDGRNRLAACRLAGGTPGRQTYTGDDLGARQSEHQATSSQSRPARHSSLWSCCRSTRHKRGCPRAAIAWETSCTRATN